MKLNIISTAILLLGGSIAFSSCTDVLDKKPLDLMTEDDVWSDANLAQAAVYNAYSSVHYFTKFEGEGKSRGADCQTDQYWTHWQLGDCTDDANWTTSTNFGWNAFSDVRKTNVAIEHLKDESVRNNIGIQTADDLLGQALFLKSAIYFRQARKFGGWIIVENTLDDAGVHASSDESAAESLQLPRASMKETYDYAIELCEEAATLMNDKNQFGELSKGSAYALLSEMCLQAAIYLQTYEGTDPKPYLEKAIQAVEDLDNMKVL